MTTIVRGRRADLGRLPDGFRVVLDHGTRRPDPAMLTGGSPARLMRLSVAGQSALAELESGPIRSRSAAVLARRLTDAGLAHPQPPAPSTALDLTVIIPVRDRPAMLAACLHSIGSTHRVIVVDDGSRDPGAVAAVCAEHGADLVRRSVNGGPGAARNTGLEHATTDAVAFLDSDCIAPPGWAATLAAHLADPLVAAAAPRILAGSSTNVTNATAAAADLTSASATYTAANSGLDLGPHASRVRPRSRVAFVPTAALVVRRSALLAVAKGGPIFDPQLRFGEDVDLVWRLHEAGWRIRYDPSVVVAHREPATIAELLTRRFRYGTSAGPLARRHPDAMTPLVLHPLPAITVAAALARRPALAAVGAAATVAVITRGRQRNLVAGQPLPTAATAIRETWLGIGRYATQFASPLLIAALFAPVSKNGRRGRRIAAASLLLGPPLRDWAARRPALNPLRFTIARIADDIAYGAGVLTGSAAARTLTPLRPVIARRTRRIEAAEPTPSINEESSNG
jgi:mycofactocin glycosyltransferase